MANGFKTGGRQKGVPNKSTTEKQRQAREVGQLVMAFAGLARLRGLEGFSSARSLSINELAEKVFTTEVSRTSRR